MACYERNGTANPDTYVKCEGSSMCCRTNDDRADSCIDTGRLRGLCKGGPVLWREGCTSRDWSSSECVPLCTEGQYYNGGNDLVNASESHIMITECGFDDSLCCGLGDEAIACCNGERGTKYWIKDLKVYTTRPDMTVTILSTRSTSSPTETTTENSISITTGEVTSSLLKSFNEASVESLNSRGTSITTSPLSSASSPISSQISSNPATSTPVAAIAGGVVGGVVGLALLLAIAFLVTRRHYRKPPPASHHARPNIELQSDHRQELPSNSFIRVELPVTEKGFGETRFHELDAETKRY